MANMIHIERDQVKAACAAFEKLLAEDPNEKRELKEREQQAKAEKARRDKEFAATQPKPQSPRRTKK